MRVHVRAVFAFAICISLPFTFLFVLIPLALSRHAQDISFNQFGLQKHAIETGVATPEIAVDYLVSSFSLGLDRLTSSASSFPKDFDWKDPKSVFEYVFFRIPARAMVYPTETYYYYAFDVGDKALAGNFRFVDAHLGVLHIGYFDRIDPHSSRNGSGSFGKEDGVTVKMKDAFTAQVTYQGISRTFSLNPDGNLKPQDLVLLPEEEFVTRVFDESGFEFALLFNTSTKAFYFVSNHELSFPDSKAEGQNNYILAPQSSFVFYNDPDYDRMILVGVHEKNIYMNSYYDGPFDQVPPRLDLRDKIYGAYPYTRWRGGIDLHGNFLMMKNTRVAISPYTNYRKLKDLVEYQERCFKKQSKGDLWSCLAYEWKRDFHRSRDKNGDLLKTGIADHRLYKSQGWPANHYNDVSVHWPSAHQAEKSATWPPNFQGFDDSESEEDLTREYS
ncbi:MAG: hypothetical protein KDD70_16970, partial [Bdellovibrionales bacterium]|nr:hypothetical protein [Bdellovibrionales bacterium]